MCQRSCRPRKKTTHNHQIWAPQIARFGVAGHFGVPAVPGFESLAVVYEPVTNLALTG